MVNNGPLVALAYLKMVEPTMQFNKRAQLDRAKVLSGKELIVTAMDKITSAGLDCFFAQSYLQSAVDCMDNALNDKTFVETDTAFKDIIVSKVNPAINLLYVAVGKYYCQNEFNFQEKMIPILKEVVDHCIAEKEYFGYDKEIREENVVCG